MNNIKTTKKIKLVDGSTVEIDFSKVQVVSTKMEDRHKFTFPKEGWFVGAYNSPVNKKDSFKYGYLYSPNWATLKHEWGGYIDNELTRYVTLNHVTSNGMCIDYLYVCVDIATAKSLTKLLNSIPSRNIKTINSDILSINRKIDDLLEKMKSLMDMDKTCSQLLTTAI